MTPKQAARRARIEQAAYEVLSEAGYNSASLLTIAKRASASNETLYKWYGNKQALFRSLVEANASEAKVLLEQALGEGSDPLEALARLGPALLALVTGGRAVALNRAAAGDASDTGTLGKAIADAGRETIAPLLSALLGRAQQEGLIACRDPAEAAETYFHLLIGDLQIRRVIGVIDELPQQEIERRAQRAFHLFRKLHVPEASRADL
ncbi:TetR/AcrR family transcriptional regulator [Mesorhizobium xinjiangense]|uniref:TetR/AcrR family transcriptional regulator n=1 Tax=Mesorhizobium xinjiangense TaxID=2678685 RepID=UPI0012ED2A50|nr:TetR/AcrR family transcriptional regulator C-terminal domain-containing protein [Mesorhizobium xinjiangense]